MTTRPAAADPSVGTCDLSKVLGLRPLAELYAEQADGTVADDPLSLFAAEAAQEKAGDHGVPIRQTAADAKSEIIRLSNETLGPLKTQKFQFESSGYKVVYARWLDTITSNRDEAVAALDEIYASGLEMSAQFKKGTGDAQAMMTEMGQSVAAAEEHLRAFKAGLAAIDEEISRERRTLDEAKYESMKKFFEAKSAIEAELDKCLRWDYSEAADIAARLKALSDTADRSNSYIGFQEANAALPPIAKAIADLIAAKASAYQAKQREVLEEIGKVETKLQAHERFLLGSDLGKEQKAAIENKLNAAKTMAENGRNAAAMDVAKTVVAEAMVLIDAIDSHDVGIVKTKADEIERMINASKIRPNDASQLIKQLGKLRTSIAAINVNEAQTQLATFRTKVEATSSPGDWTTYQGRVELQASWKSRIEDAAGRIDVEIKKFNAAFGGEDYSGSMVTDLKTLKAMVQGEVGKDTGKDAMELAAKIMRQIDVYKPALDTSSDDAEASAKARKLLVEDQMEAKQAAEALRLAKEEFESALSIAKTNVELAPSNIEFQMMLDSDAGAKADYDACNEMLTSAKESAEKTNDYATAGNMLKAVDRNLKKLQKQASGAQFNDLKKVGEFWRAGTILFRAKVEEVKAAMDAACTDEERLSHKAQLDEVKASLDGLVAFYQPTAFKDCADKFATTTDMNARKRLREEVLRRVRLYRESITSNPVMKTIVGNPFGVKGVATGLYAHLNKIELETLRTL